MTMSSISRLAIILTHNRPGLLAECIAAISPQVDQVIAIDNASDPPAEVERGVTLVQISDQPPNISKMWNVGIAMAVDAEATHIAVLCDDTAAPAGWFAAVVEAMDQTGAVVGCSDPFSYLPPGHVRVKTEPDGAIMERMPGPAWILDPRSSVRPDDQFAWWWGDTDVDWQARKAGGMVMIGGYPVPNIRPNENTARLELAERAGRDAEAFSAKWGWRPW